MSNKDQALNRIPVDAGVVVSVPLESYTAMRESYAKYENMLQHHEEHELNLAAKDQKIKELEDQLLEKEITIGELHSKITNLSEGAGTSKSKSGIHVEKPAKPKPPRKK